MHGSTNIKSAHTVTPFLLTEGDILIHSYVFDADIYHCKYYLGQNDKDNYMWKNVKRIEWSGHGFRVGKTGQRVRLYKRPPLWLCWIHEVALLQLRHKSPKVERLSSWQKSTVTDELFNDDV